MPSRALGRHREGLMRLFIQHCDQIRKQPISMNAKLKLPLHIIKSLNFFSQMTSSEIFF